VNWSACRERIYYLTINYVQRLVLDLDSVLNSTAPAKQLYSIDKQALVIAASSKGIKPASSAITQVSEDIEKAVHI